MYMEDCKTEVFFDAAGILLEAKESISIDPEIQRLVSDTCKKMEDLLI